MAKYLDYAGLQYLWAKIKNYVSTQPLGANVRYDQQTLTTAQQAQARANIAAGGSNRNLLDNGWFRVNQRSATSGSGTTASYIADRWTVTYGNGGVTWSRTDDTITIASANGVSHGDIAQRMEKSLFDYLVGKIVTVSVMLENYSIVSKAITFNSGSAPTIGTDTDGNSIVFRAYQSSTFQDVQIWKYNTPGTFRAVKLELGSVSTLANDTPPDYAEELAKCQRYFLRLKSSSQALPLGFGVQSSSTAVRLLIPTPVEMRAQPTVSFSGTHRIFGGDATSKTVSSYSVVDRTSSGIGLVASISSGTFAENKAYILYVASGGYLDLSADL